MKQKNSCFFLYVRGLSETEQLNPSKVSNNTVLTQIPVELHLQWITFVCFTVLSNL